MDSLDTLPTLAPISARVPRSLSASALCPASVLRPVLPGIQPSPTPCPSGGPPAASLTAALAALRGARGAEVRLAIARAEVARAVPDSDASAARKEVERLRAVLARGCARCWERGGGGGGEKRTAMGAGRRSVVWDGVAPRGGGRRGGGEKEHGKGAYAWRELKLR